MDKLKLGKVPKTFLKPFQKVAEGLKMEHKHLNKY